MIHMHLRFYSVDGPLTALRQCMVKFERPRRYVNNRTAFVPVQQSFQNGGGGGGGGGGFGDQRDYERGERIQVGSISLAHLNHYSPLPLLPNTHSSLILSFPYQDSATEQGGGRFARGGGGRCGSGNRGGGGGAFGGNRDAASSLDDTSTSLSSTHHPNRTNMYAPQSGGSSAPVYTHPGVIFPGSAGGAVGDEAGSLFNSIGIGHQVGSITLAFGNRYSPLPFPLIPNTRSLTHFLFLPFLSRFCRRTVAHARTSATALARSMTRATRRSSPPRRLWHRHRASATRSRSTCPASLRIKGRRRQAVCVVVLVEFWRVRCLSFRSTYFTRLCPIDASLDGDDIVDMT
jgi:hypothetical protein